MFVEIKIWVIKYEIVGAVINCKLVFFNSWTVIIEFQHHPYGIDIGTLPLQSKTILIVIYTSHSHIHSLHFIGALYTKVLG